MQSRISSGAAAGVFYLLISGDHNDSDQGQGVDSTQPTSCKR